MAKKGMARPECTQHPENTKGIVPELQGKAKTGKKKANPIIAGTMGAQLKVYHEKPIPKAYREIDTDLAREMTFLWQTSRTSKGDFRRPT